MDLQVIFLGTAGSIPTTQRSLPAVAVKRTDELFLFDAGEGVQRQMIRAKIGFHRKAQVFITHMHGDHVLGLPGLMQTMALLNRKKKLEIYGPIGIKRFIDAIEETVQFARIFPITVKEVLEEGVISEEHEYTVQAAQADHVTDAWAYALNEKPRPGRFNQQKARKLGIPEGPLWSRLQHGEKVTLPNGKKVTPEDVLGKPRAGRKMVYTGDTRPTNAIVKLAKNADLLIHEATLNDDLKERAQEDGHSTPGEAAEIAKRAGVKQLVLTHVSARYKTADALLEQARKTFKNVIVAEDFMRIELKQLK